MRPINSAAAAGAQCLVAPLLAMTRLLRLQSGGASSKVANSKPGATVQPTRVQSPSERAACQACAGTMPCGRSPPARSLPSMMRSGGFDSARMPVPDFDRVHPVPVRALTARQEKIDCGRDGTRSPHPALPRKRSREREGGVAKSLAIVPAFRMWFFRPRSRMISAAVSTARICFCARGFQRTPSRPGCRRDRGSARPPAGPRAGTDFPPSRRRSSPGWWPCRPREAA